MKLLLCTQNKDKIKEIKLALKDFSLVLVDLEMLKDLTQLEETGQTFKENALLKAKYFANKYKMIAIADDTGLEVKYLNNRPGVHSSRYAKSDQEKINKLLAELQNTNIKNARFVTVIALYNPFNQTAVYFTGVLQGKITSMPKGVNGFGYDPIFYLPEFNKTLAELTLFEKVKLSHRSRALEKLKEHLNENINNF